MIKLVLFDLDGVLIDAKEIHFRALNDALGEFAISQDDHIRIFDGKKTTEKLDMLSEQKGLPIDTHQSIWDKKQALTKDALSNLVPITAICDLFVYLKKEGYAIGVCSNSIRESIFTALSRVGLMSHVAIVVSNEDVKYSKPHPAMYWAAMSKLGHLPAETLIVEDSPVGLLAAKRSGANYMRVENPTETTIDNISRHLTAEKEIMNTWKHEKLNVLIPMAGLGSRFEKAGYTFPKPLIEVHGKPMIQTVVDNIGIEAKYHFVVQKDHRQKYNLDSVLGLIAPGCKIIEVDGITEGAACTALLAKEFIDNDQPLFFGNSDQFAEWDPAEFMYHMQERDADGGILTFKSTHPKWSYAKVNELGEVTEVAEKNPISDKATVGYYYWKHGSDFVKYAEQMIKNDVRVNGEFYVCPVFNEAIQDGKKILTFTADKMWGLGTPEDLNYYLENYDK